MHACKQLTMFWFLCSRSRFHHFGLIHICVQVKEENAISEELSDWQDGVSELMGSSSTDLDVKTGQLSSVLKKADDLRLRTVRKVVDLLTPQQAVEFLIAASELHFGVRGWGINQDRHRGNF